jgi:hypothetical protein
MARQSNATYWPHMILGFLAVGLILGYWTIKSASNLPVQESNTYMLKYQKADMTINEILTKKEAFDHDYTITLEGVETMVMTDNIHSKRKQIDPVRLVQGENRFAYRVTTKEGKVVDGAKVSFLLTRPHTRVDDLMVQSVAFTNGLYQTEPIEITKEGRYTLELRVVINDEQIGYASTPAYLKL